MLKNTLLTTGRDDMIYGIQISHASTFSFDACQIIIVQDLDYR